MCSTTSLTSDQLQSTDSHSPLYVAIRKGRVRDVEAHVNTTGIEIIDSNNEKTFIEITIPCPFLGKSISFSPLHYAISSQQWIIAKIFVTRFPKLLWVTDGFGQPPIITLIRSPATTKHEEIEALYLKMLELGPSLDEIFNGKSPLHELCRSKEASAPKLIQATKTYLIKSLNTKRLKRCDDIAVIMKVTLTSWPIALFPLVTGFLCDDAQLNINIHSIATHSISNPYKLLTTSSSHHFIWCNSPVLMEPLTPWRYALWNKNKSALELCIQLGLEPAHINKWISSRKVSNPQDLSLFMQLYEQHSKDQMIGSPSPKEVV